MSRGPAANFQPSPQPDDSVSPLPRKGAFQTGLTINDTPYFFDFDRAALIAWLAQHRRPRYRADQLLRWVYQHGLTDPQKMTDLSGADREMLAGEMRFETWRLVADQHATDGTRKLLLQRDRSTARRPTPNDAVVANGPSAAGGSPAGPAACDPPAIECVMIPAESRDSGKARRTACLSSQVGCPVGCAFCASGLGGLQANLTAGQIVEQIHQLNRLTAQRHAATTDAVPATMENRKSTLSHVVFMGMGEPLANFDAVVRAIRTLVAPWAYNLSARRITVSTVGLPAPMRRLADQLDLPVTLAISLHAPNDELRAALIPWAQRTSIDRIIDAGRYYFDRTGREVTLEYLLLRRVNDRPEHAGQLARIAKKLRCNVNLIRYNEVKGLPFDRPTAEDVHAFEAVLRRAGVNVHLRASRGRDIAAACGQLRHDHR